MIDKKGLSFKYLKKYYNTRSFSFNTTKELDDLQGIIGQDRAEKALKFGLEVDSPGYNMFICGEKGTGRTTYCLDEINNRAKNNFENNKDWCYVYNFDEPLKPIALSLKAGMAKELQQDMVDLIKFLISYLPKAFMDEEYQKTKNDIIKKFHDEKSDLIDELMDYCDEMGFEIKNITNGLVFAPLVDGEELSDEEYDLLDEDVKEYFSENSEKIQWIALKILKRIKLIELESDKNLSDYQKLTSYMILSTKTKDMISKYSSEPKVVEYIRSVEEDIVENIKEFLSISEEELPTRLNIKEFAPRYYVNIIVDNTETTGKAVVYESNPNFTNLVGSIEYKNENALLKTDFTMISPGALHLANGGYLVLDALELLRNPQAWQVLKNSLYDKEIFIDNIKRQLGVLDVATLEPEIIPLDVKVVLIGSANVYSLLYKHDEDFKKLFKIKVDFNHTMDNSDVNREQLAQFIARYCNENGLKHLSKDAVIKSIEYSNRLVGTQNKLTTNLNKFSEILIEADTWADIEGNTIVTGDNVQKAIVEKRNRENKIEYLLDDLYKNNKIIIDVSGRKIGRINGLYVMSTGDYSFGRSVVITVSTYAGAKGIINIEREADLSGSIHDKGVMILEGYLNERFAKNKPLNITSKICFEQSYNGIDGDSASSTELYAILSSISEVPLKQNIAVTGSVNQKGEIQPVGGINEKIEGFFSICEREGLTSEQGVLIPHQNVSDLVLDDKVIEAVRLGKFHIYPVKNISEGMELLTDMDYDRLCSLIKENLKKYEVKPDK